MQGEDQTDLAAFVRDGSQPAFERLAARHAGMVYAVCLSQLGSRDDAQDAAQAVFLALARKAGGIRPDRAGSWLYGVAMRTSRFAARSRARRARHEEEAGRMMASAEVPGAGAVAVSPEERSRLVAEIEDLPAALREAVVRHYLGGQSRAELAAELGVPEGTVQSRLGAGLERLRQRLAGRGTVLGLTAVGSILAGAAEAGAPAALLASIPTLASGNTAALATAGAGTKAVALAEGVLRMMFWEKVKVIAVSVAAAGLLAGATPLALGAFSGEKAPAVQAPASPAPAAAAPEKAPAPAAKVEIGPAVDKPAPGKPEEKPGEATVVKAKVNVIDRTGVVYLSPASKDDFKKGDTVTCKANGWTGRVTAVYEGRGVPGANVQTVKAGNPALKAGDEVELVPAAGKTD